MSSFHIFGGRGTDLGTVKLLEPTTWEDFVKETLGHAILLNVTRAQYAAMEKKERQIAKRVAYVTPATFKTTPSKRLHEFADTFHIIAIDLDQDPDGNCPAAPFVKDQNMLYQQLAGLQFAAYTTSSSTPEAPRLRIFVRAAGLPIKEYARAVYTVAGLLGLPSVNKESLIVVQPMFLPTMFRGDDATKSHPLIATTIEGEALTADDLGIAAIATAPTATGKSSLFSTEGDDLDYLRPTVDGLEIEDIHEALATIDPDLSYPEWLEIAAALRHQFPEEPLASEAYTLFDEWSAKGEKYVDSEDTLAKWNSLRATPRGRAPVTIRTILHKAQEAGWESTKISTKCYANTVKWLTATTTTGNQLMAEGIKRIAATPLLSSLERGTLLSALQDSMKDKGLKVLRTDLKKELYRLERSANKQLTPNSTPDAQLPLWCRGTVYVAGANEFYHRATNRALKPEAFDYCYNAFLTESDSVNAKPTMLARDYALNMAKIPRVDNYRYDPATADQAFIYEAKHKFINTYQPTYPEPVLADMQQAGEIFLNHLATLISEDEYITTLIDWLAYQVQFPGQKIRWAVLLQGAEGCGKTAIAEAMLAVMGAGNVTTQFATMLLKDMFNGWATGSQLVAIEEIRVIGQNRHEMMNRLKPCISNDHLSIRTLFKAAVQVPNNTNYIMFTNHHDSLAIGEGDRRYYVVNSALQNKSQVRALPADHFPTYYDMLKNKAGGLRAWFMEWKISKNFNPQGYAPVTKYLAELMKASATPLTSAVADAISDADHPLVSEDLISSRCLKGLIETQNLPRFTDQNLASVLRELDYVLLGRFRLDEDRHYLWTKRGSKMMDYADVSAEAKKRMKKGAHVGADGKPSGLEVIA